MPILTRTARALATGVGCLLLATACSTGGTPPAPADSAEPLTSSAADDSTVVIGGDRLPDSWPDGLPSYVDGALVSAAISEGGTQINAVWHSPATLDQTWTTVESGLRAAGFRPLGEIDGSDAFIADDTMITDTYRSEAFELNVSVLSGDPVTVLFNASAL